MIRRYLRPVATVCATGCISLSAQAQGTHPSDTERIAANGVLGTVVVSATREAQRLAETPASIGVIDAATVRSVGATHPQQILNQVPGVAVSVTNGEGHTTAIRQPFTTAPLYLFLEDGLPIRATGFFNHNALYELDLPMAGGIEVTRGPGSALYGSDAIGGIVNMLTRAPNIEAGFGGTIDVGSYGWRRLMLEAHTGEGAAGALRLGANLTESDGWRDDTAYERQSVDARWDFTTESGLSFKTVLSAGRIDQATGANSPLIYRDYQDDPTRNNFPIAYREVEAVRLSTAIEKEFGDGLLSITPYVRDNRMELLASFALSFDPTVYTTKNQSYGAMLKWRHDFLDFMRARIIGGIDVDVSPGEREEYRLNATVSGAGASRVFSDYTIGNRIYDYDVTFRSYSPYVHAEFSPLERMRVTAGLRYDVLSYEFENSIDEPFVQGAAAAFYGQAQNVDVEHERLSPKLGVTYELNDSMHVYASYNSGFRVPSEGQLFRPSAASSASEAVARAQLVLALKPITATQVELGWRGKFDRWSMDVAAFELTKRDDLVSQRDLATNATTNVNAGKTSHRGIELGLGVALLDGLRLDTSASYTRHRYERWVTTSADFSGNEMETAPRVIANARLSWQPVEAMQTQLEWVHVDEYWLEASNSPAFPKYPGHDLLNARANWQVAPGIAVFARIMNMIDVRYADNASISSNTPVYSPGLPRTYFAGIDIQW